MSFARKFNASNVFEINTDGMPFCKLSALYNKHGKNAIFEIGGFFISQGGTYGPTPVIITPNVLVNLPNHLLETVRNIISDDEAIETVKQGLVGFKVREYQTKDTNKTCYSITFVDIDGQTQLTTI